MTDDLSTELLTLLEKKASDRESGSHHICIIR